MAPPEATVSLRGAREADGQRKVQRNEELFKKELISASEKNEMEIQTRLAGLERRQQQEVLNLRTIVSPIDGGEVERFNKIPAGMRCNVRFVK